MTESLPPLEPAEPDWGRCADPPRVTGRMQCAACEVGWEYGPLCWNCGRDVTATAGD